MVGIAVWMRNEMAREISKERDIIREEVRKEIEEAPGKLIQDLLGTRGEEGKNKKGRGTAGKDSRKKGSEGEEKSDRAGDEDAGKGGARGEPKEPRELNEPKDLLGGLLGAASKVFKAVDRIGLDLTRMSEEEEMRLGKAMNKSFLAEHEVVTDAAIAKRIRTLSAPLLEQRTRKGIQYQINVFKMDAPNALSFAGGNVYVSTGYLKEFPSDAALTFVLGHEIGHVDLKHCIEKMQYLVVGNEIAGDLSNLPAAAYLTLRSAYTKDQEFEADEFGFRAAREAGFSAEALIQCLRDLEALEKKAEAAAGRQRGDKPGGRPENPLEEIFSTHPATSARVKRLEAVSRTLEASPKSSRESGTPSRGPSVQKSGSKEDSKGG